MSDTTNTVVEQICTALETLDPFNYSTYVDNIKSILAVDEANFDVNCSALVYGENPGGDSSVINRFKVETIALGVSRTSGYGFSDDVVKNGLSDKIIASAAALVVPMYRHYLEDHIAKTVPNLSLLSLVQDRDFCRAYIQKILDPAFVTDYMIAQYLQMNEYVQAIAYVYERTRDTLASAPTNVEIVLAAGPVKATQIGQLSLPDIDVFANTVRSNVKLSQAGKTLDFFSSCRPITWGQENPYKKPIFPALGAIWATQWQTDDYSARVASSLIAEETVLPVMPPPHGSVTGNNVRYGDRLWKWMVDMQSHGFSDIFQVQGTENLEWIPAPSPFGCFTPDTLVDTSRGARRISDLQAGDRILTRAPGEFGILSDERVVHDLKPAVVGRVKVRPVLYGVNQEKPFFTAAHIFFTLLGPKAIDPSQSRNDNEDIHVGTLQPGDVLLRLNKDKSGYEHITVRSIHAEVATCSTVHGLHFRRGAGGGRYHANGYFVGENYPDVTICALMKRFLRMGIRERKAFVRHLNALPPTFREVFGPVLHDTFKSTFGDAVKLHKAGLPKDQPPSAHLAGLPPSLDLLHTIETSPAALAQQPVSALQHQFHLIPTAELDKRNKKISDVDHESAARLSDQQNALVELCLVDGAVMCNRKLVSNASVSHKGVQWSRPLDEKADLFEHGTMRRLGNYHALTGFIAKGPRNAHSVEQLSDVQHVTAIRFVDHYTMQRNSDVSKTIVEAQALSGTQDWAEFWKVDIALVKDDSSGGLSITLSMPDLDPQWQAYLKDNSISPTTQLYTQGSVSANDQHQLNITITLYDVMAPLFPELLKAWKPVVPGGGGPAPAPGPTFKTFNVLVNLTNNEVHGYYTELLLDKADIPSDGPIHALWSPGQKAPAQVAMLGAVQQSPTHAARASVASVHQPCANYHEPSLPATVALSEHLFSGQDLSIADLQAIKLPSADSLNNLAQTYMEYAAQYWADPPEAAMFGNNKAVMKSLLPVELTDGLTNPDYQKFFAKFGRAILMQSLSTTASTDPASNYSQKFSEADRTVLNYFWQGSLPGCLAEDSSFNAVSAIATGKAFANLVKDLDPYRADSADWAMKLYTFLTTDDELGNLALDMFTSTDNITNGYSLKIGALDKQNRGLDVKLWQLVRAKLLGNPANAVVSYSDEFPQWAVEFCKQLILRIQTESSQDQLLVALKGDLANLEQVFQNQTAAELAATLFGETGSIGRYMKNVASQLGKLTQGGGAGILPAFMYQLTEASTADGTIKELKPGIVAMTSFVGVVLGGYSLYTSWKVLCNWSSLSWENRMTAITGTLNTLVNLFKDSANTIGNIIDGIRGKDVSKVADQISLRGYCGNWTKLVGAQGPKAATQIQNGDGTTTTTPTLNEAEIQGVNPALAEETIATQVARVTTQSEELLENLGKTFSWTEVICKGFAVLANVAMAVSLGFEIADDFINDKGLNRTALDLATEATTIAQTVIEGVEIYYTMAGIESACLPGLGAAVAVLGIILMAVEEWENSSNPPESPVNLYIDGNKDAFIASLTQPPSTLLNYHFPFMQNTVTADGYPSTITINVTDPLKSKPPTLLRAVNIRFETSSSPTALFSAPSGKNANGYPTTNVINATVSGAFTLTTSTFAGTDGYFLVNIASTDPAGTPITDGGVKIQISGSGNAWSPPSTSFDTIFGHLPIHVGETTATRPDHAAAIDVFTSLIGLKI